MPSNSAAWLVSDKAHPLEIKPNEYTKPTANQVVVKNSAVALNLVDWATQGIGTAVFTALKHPAVLGHDVAGEAVEVGSAVKHVKVGDRVLGMGLGPIGGGPAYSAFQEYTVCEGTVVAPIPASLAFTDAAVIPLALSTAASGLFGKDWLGLDLPSIPAAPSKGQTLLIWGGASSVGTNAIQMVAAAGYEIITTASPKNWDYLKKLGATHTFAYNSDSVTQDIVQAFKGKHCAGALAIGQTSAQPCIDIIEKIDKGRKFVACANLPPEKVPDGVEAKFIIGDSLVKNEVGPALYAEWIPKGLEKGSFVPSPPAEVIGKGLGAVQAGLDSLPKGVSKKKLVVDLS